MAAQEPLAVTPSEHLGWFEENIAFFERVTADQLDIAVPACPGWTVEDVLNHLARGLGIGYSLAISTPADSTAAQAFASLPGPDYDAHGVRCTEQFSANMRNCLALFRATAPDWPCFTYSGPGNAAFWFLRAAVETSLHRLDVELALHGAATPLPAQRALAAIDETLTFALPLAASIVGEPNIELEVVVDGAVIGTVGQGQRAELAGSGTDVLTALWGRSIESVVATNGAAEWLSLVERAFAQH